jgi:hypothetical protein
VIVTSAYLRPAADTNGEVGALSQFALVGTKTSQQGADLKVSHPVLTKPPASVVLAVTFAICCRFFVSL